MRKPQIIVLATVKGRNATYPVKLLMDGETTLANLHVRVLEAINAQHPQHSGKPVSAIRYSTEENRKH